MTDSTIARFSASPQPRPRRFFGILLSILIVGIPSVCIIVLSTTQFRRARNALQVTQTMTDNHRLLGAASRLTHELQLERGIATMIVAGNSFSNDRLKQQQQLIVKTRAEFQQALRASRINQSTAASALQNLTQLETVRQKMANSAHDDWQSVFHQYESIIDAVLSASAAVTSAVTAPEISTTFAEISLLQNARESAGTLRGYLTAKSVSNETFNREEFELLQTACQQLNASCESSSRKLADRNALKPFVDSPEWESFHKAIASVQIGEPIDLIWTTESLKFFALGSHISDQLFAEEKKLLASLDQRLLNRLEENRRQRNWAILWGLGGFLSILILATLGERWRRAHQIIRATNAEMHSALIELELQRDALDQHAIVSIVSAGGKITYVNDKEVEITGYSREELIGKSYRMFKSGHHDLEFYRTLWETVTSGNIWKGEVCNRRRDGSLYWVETTLIPFRNPEGQIDKYVVIRTDITDRKEVEQQLALHRERYEMAVQGSRDALWDWNLITDEIYYAPQWAELLGLPIDDIKQCPEFWISHIVPEDYTIFRRELTRHIEGQTKQFEVEVRMIRHAGDLIWTLCRASVTRDDAGKAVRLSGSLADINEIKEAQAQLRRIADTDALTGLWSRELFHDRLQQALKRTARHENKFAILFFDFDRFKVINDSLGHNIGDALLVEIARIFERELRELDTAARFGGDEFVVLLEELATWSAAEDIAQRLLEVFAQPHLLGGHQIVSTASIGLVTNEHGYHSANDMIRDADAAMFEAKETGRGRVVTFDQEMHDKALDRLKLENDLRGAVEIDQFHLLYQPITNLETGQVSGFEALLRWVHPERGLISPVNFIPIAEDTGLIIEIGKWVLAEACRQLHEWNSKIPESIQITMNVNVSKRQLLLPNFVDETIDCIRDAGVLPQQLKIEITETTIVDNRCDMIPMLERLRQHGIQIAMDDFGTGHSSLSGLHQFPIDVLKIDQSFISGLDDSRELIAVVSSIMMLAENLGIDTVAEGIETAEQLVLLQSVNCISGQGYYFAKPLPPEKALQFFFAQEHLAEGLIEPEAEAA